MAVEKLVIIFIFLLTRINVSAHSYSTETTGLSIDQFDAIVNDEETKSNLRGRSLARRVLCIDLGGSKGKQTFEIDSNFKWFKKSSGATKGPCDEANVKKLKSNLQHLHTYWKEFSSQCREIQACEAAWKWLKKQGVKRGSCKDNSNRRQGKDIHLTLK
ncbi:hypothetical protein ACHAXS_013947 [Conticribra weissflogii]